MIVAPGKVQQRNIIYTLTIFRCHSFDTSDILIRTQKHFTWIIQKLFHVFSEEQNFALDHVQLCHNTEWKNHYRSIELVELCIWRVVSLCISMYGLVNPSGAEIFCINHGDQRVIFNFKSPSEQVNK